MKKIILIIILLPVLIGCNQKKIEQLESRNDSLVQLNYERDLSVNEFLEAINDIQTNLDSIKSKEMIISEQTADGKELKKNVQDQVNSDINSIYSLLLDARSKLDDARKKLGRSDYQVKEFEKMLSNMTSQIEEKDRSIVELREELEKMNIKLPILRRMFQGCHLRVRRNLQLLMIKPRLLKRKQLK
jgi:chromosome segregation ATPase